MPLQNGERCNIVAFVTMRDDHSDGGHWCQGVLTGQRFRLKASIPISAGCPKVTILNAAKSFFRWPILVVDEKAELLIHPPKDQSSLFALTETCSGLGGLGCGAEYAGWKVVAQNDINSKYMEHQAKHTNIPVVTGDIGDMQTVVALHRTHSASSVMAFGFPCQPYSTAGDRKHGSDPRAAVLPNNLYAAFLLQMEIVVCECVPGAATSKHVLSCLEYYMEMTQSDRSEVLLELADMWPSRRRRWWTVILMQYYGKVKLCPLTKLDLEPTVACLLPKFLDLAQSQLAQLLLTADERKGFSEFGKGIGSHLVERNQPMATALHAWGNQLISCSCGCRPAFSYERLVKSGLFGALVHVPNMEPHQNLRHISPQEVALLCGFPKKSGWDDNQRLLLSGIGQLASPLQAAWVFAQLRNHLIESKVVPGQCISPKEILNCATTDLFDLRDLWAPDATSVTTQMFQEQFDDWLIQKTGPTCTPKPDSFEDLTCSQEAELLAHVSVAEKQDPPEHALSETSPVGSSHQLQAEQHPSFPEATVPLSEASQGSPETLHASDVHSKPIQSDPALMEHSSLKELSVQGHSQSEPPNHHPSTVQDAGEFFSALPKSESLPNALVSNTSVEPAFKKPNLGTHADSKPPQNAVSADNPRGHDLSHVPQLQSFSSANVQENMEVSKPCNTSHAIYGNSCVSIAAPGTPCIATGAISAFAPGFLVQPVVPPPPSNPQSAAGEKVSRTRQLPDQVCESPQSLLKPGVMVYDVDNHQITLHACHAQSTFRDWVTATTSMQIEYSHCVDLFGQTIRPEANLHQLRWIVASQTRPFTLDLDFTARTFALQSMPRLESILLQGYPVASDEMIFYLHSVASAGLAKVRAPFILDGMTDLHLDAQQWLTESSQYEQCRTLGLVQFARSWFQTIPQHEATVTAIWVDHHWHPIWMVPSSQDIIVHTTLSGFRLWELLFPWWPSTIMVHDELPQQFQSDCGFRAFAWLVAQCSHTNATALTIEEAIGWRHLYWQHLLLQAEHPQFFVLGGQGELETALKALLRSHGVFAARLHDRTTTVMNTFPHQDIGSSVPIESPMAVTQTNCLSPLATF